MIRVEFELPEITVDQLKRLFPAVYTDGTHLGATTEDELHRFARRIGLKRRWFQPTRYPHYDLTTPRMVAKALAAGANKVTKRDFLYWVRQTA